METNNLVYNIKKVAKNGDQYDIKIMLNDECKNGYQFFSITGTVYLAGKKKSERNIIICGAIGNEIAEKFPELSIFADLHLCDFNGSPLYTVSNGFYNIKRMGEVEFMLYFRCNWKEYEILSSSEDEKHFSYLLSTTNIPQRWKQQAETAIKELEKLTGNTFINDSVRSNFTPLSENEKTEFRKKVENGFYSKGKIEERKRQKREDKREKEIEKITFEKEELIKKANLEYTVKLSVINAGLPLSNFIFYSHNKKGVFNWKESDEKISTEEFYEFKRKVNIQGVTFEIK